MNAKKPRSPKPEVHVHDVSKLPGKLRVIGGSMSDDWNNILANQTVQTLWFFENTDAEEIRRRRHAAIDALIGIRPRDELEGMRAMLREQTFEGRREGLNQANKLSRTYATLLESLNRHRGKGAQKVTVEHVHVHAGGQAVVGTVETPGGGVSPKSKDQPHALTHAPGTTMPSTDAPRDAVPVPSDAERSMPDARRPVTRRTEGE
jgi:hypothetical protein